MVVSWWRQWMSPVTVLTILMLYRWEKARWPPPSLQVSNWMMPRMSVASPNLTTLKPPLGRKTLRVDLSWDAAMTPAPGLQSP